MLLHGSELYFFKDLKHRQENATFHNEPPIQLNGCVIQPSEYSKRKNVISLRLPFGSEYLFQCAEEVIHYLSFNFLECNLIQINLGRHESMACEASDRHWPFAFSCSILASTSTIFIDSNSSRTGSSSTAKSAGTCAQVQERRLFLQRPKIITNNLAFCAIMFC